MSVVHSEKKMKPLYVTLAFSFLMLASCQKPQDAYESVIKQQGFIPYRAPSTSTSVGTVVRGNANTFTPAAPASTCFPDDLTWFDAVDLPNSYKEFTLSYSNDLSAVTQNGNPTVEFKTDYKIIKTVDIKFEDASIQYLDQFKFKSFYDQNMSDACKAVLLQKPFVLSALKVGKMSFTFKDERGGSIELTAANIKDIVNIHSGIEWSIKDDMTLEVTTPKYLGYTLAKLRASDDGNINQISNSIDKNGNFQFKTLRRR
jgi:hypothetical protein